MDTEKIIKTLTLNEKVETLVGYLDTPLYRLRLTDELIDLIKSIKSDMSVIK